MENNTINLSKIEKDKQIYNNNNKDEVSENGEEQRHFKRTMDTTFKKKNERAIAVQIYREVHWCDSVEWFKNNKVPSNVSIITSLPDISEVSFMNVPQYKRWISDVVKLITEKLSESNVAIFYQTDIRRKEKQADIVDEYLDKSFLVMRGADEANAKIIWHKMFTSHPLTEDKIVLSRGKASFSHMICIGKNPKTIKHQEITPDIQNRGYMIYAAGMGMKACKIALDYVIGAGSDTVFDPFSGKGTVLAVANFYGLNAIGMDLYKSKAKSSFYLDITQETMERGFSKLDWKETTNKHKNNEEEKTNLNSEKKEESK